MVITCWGRKIAVLLAVCIRESGLRPHTHVRANSKPAATRAPPKAVTSQARICQVRLVTLHTRTSLTHLNPSPAGLARQTRKCMGTLGLTHTASRAEPNRADSPWKRNVRYEMEAFTLHAEPSRTEPDRVWPSVFAGWSLFLLAGPPGLAAYWSRNRRKICRSMSVGLFDVKLEAKLS